MKMQIKKRWFMVFCFSSPRTWMIFLLYFGGNVKHRILHIARNKFSFVVSSNYHLKLQPLTAQNLWVLLSLNALTNNPSYTHRHTAIWSCSVFYGALDWEAAWDCEQPRKEKRISSNNTKIKLERLIQQLSEP